MKLRGIVHIFVSLHFVLLTACSSLTESAPIAKEPPDISVLMAQGATDESDGKKDAALRVYEETAQLYPTSKLPWLRIAHIQFESANYGEAIVAANQVVARDDSDKVARSILSVSGLRVSTKAIADLGKNRALTGTVRSEAQELAGLLRESLGENILVPVVPVVAVAPVKPRTASTRRTRPAPAASTGSPFSGLK